MDNNLPTTQVTSDVQSLIDEIRTEIEEGKERAINAMEQEKRITYWSVGKHIKEHLLQNEGREDYATYVIPQLSKELSLSRTILYDSILYHEQYPDIVHSSGQLTWTHIRVLVHVPETESRQEFEQKVIEEKLSVKDLKELVKKTENQRKKSRKSW